MMALGAMRAINNHGLKVPDDISLVGFDDIPLSECVYRQLQHRPANPGNG